MLEALLLGLSTGTSCATSCAPAVLPFFLSEEASGKRNASNLLLFFLGRFLGYIAVGATLGALGSFALGYIDPILAHRAGNIAWLLVGALMLVSGLLHEFPGLRLCEAAGKLLRPGRTALLYGLFTGLNLCPPFFAAAGKVFGSGGDAFTGALFFALFFVGTSLYFLPLLFLPLFGKRLGWVRMVSRMSLILLGVYFLFFKGLLGLAFGA